MTLTDIFTKYNHMIEWYAGGISQQHKKDIVGDWLLDTLKRGNKYVDSLLYKDSGKLNFGRLRKSIFQSWYNHNRKWIANNVEYVPIMEDEFSVQPIAFPVFEDKRLTKKENDAVRYILTSGGNGKLPASYRKEVYNSISRKLYGRAPGVSDNRGVIKNKTCSKCGAFKPVSEFYVNRRNADGRTYACKECIRKQNKKQSYGLL